MESGAYTAGGDQYPVQFSVEYPDRDLNRLTTAFRIIVAIPIVIVLAAIGGNDWSVAGAASMAPSLRQEAAGFSSSRRC